MEQENRKIFVTVGSRNYPFDRLFRQLDSLFDKHEIKCDMFAQTGTSLYKPKNFSYEEFISQEEFLEKVQWADIVISHGASGSIMKSLNAGKKVIVVTRLEKYGEHINDHQIQNNEAFSANGYVLMADLELSDLGKVINVMINGTDNTVPWKNKDPMAVINELDQFIKNNWR